MHQEVSIIIDFNSLERSASGLITGKICLSFLERSFPEENWFDSVVVVLGWWLQAAINMLENPSESQKLRFMEGPFWAAISSTKNSDYWEMSCIDGRKGVHTDLTVAVDPKAFTERLLDASEKMLKECHNRKWNDGDVDLLKEVNIRIREKIRVWS